MSEDRPQEERPTSGAVPSGEGTAPEPPTTPPQTGPQWPPPGGPAHPGGQWPPQAAPAPGGTGPRSSRAPLYITLGVIGLLALAVIAFVIIAAAGGGDDVERFEAGDLSISLPARFSGGDPEQVVEDLEESGTAEDLPDALQQGLEAIRRFPELIVLFAIDKEGETAGANLVVVRVPAPVELDSAASQIESQWGAQGIEVESTSTETYDGIETRRYVTRLETPELTIEQLQFLLKEGSALYVFTFTPGGNADLDEMQPTFEESMESLTFES